MINESLLDDGDKLAELDEQGVLLALAGAGAQVRQAVALAGETQLASWKDMPRPRAIVVAARGGASIVATAVQELIGRSGPVPVITVSGGQLPSWVGPTDYVIAASLSGSTDGTVLATSEAGRRGALLLTVGQVGSPLAEASAHARGIHIPLPEPGRSAVGMPTSRTALWSLLTPALLGCEALGLLQDDELDVDALAGVLDSEAETCRPSSEAFVNPAKVLALELDNSVPVVLGTDEASGVAARRAASVFARTARVPSVHGVLPNDASEIVATFGGPLGSGSSGSIFDDPDIDGGVSTRLRLVLMGRGESQMASAVMSIADKSHVRCSTLTSEEKKDVCAMAQLVARADFAATYLALGSGINPGTNPHVADLRDALG